jgi:hypothetical protein
MLLSSAIWQNRSTLITPPNKASKRLFENEIFKEIWGEIERLDQGISAPRSATGRSMMARGPCPKYKAG